MLDLVSYIRSKRHSGRIDLISYTFKFTDEGLQDVRALPKNVKNSLRKKLRNTLVKNPVESSEELTDALNGFRSFHFHGYRVVFKIIEDIRVLAVVGIGKHDKDARKDIYSRLEEMAHSGRLAETVLNSLREFSFPSEKP